MPRYTGDIDIFVKPNTENPIRILKELDEFGFGSLDLKEEDFRSPNTVVKLCYPPVRIDIITSILGLSWDEAYEERDKGKYGDVPVYYIGLNHYILNKRASGRKKILLIWKHSVNNKK